MHLQEMKYTSHPTTMSVGLKCMPCWLVIVQRAKMRVAIDDHPLLMEIASFMLALSPIDVTNSHTPKQEVNEIH